MPIASALEDGEMSVSDCDGGDWGMTHCCWSNRGFAIPRHLVGDLC